jgi:mannose/fructose/N-acetylgalactosamine-specific phosphotransferase system component IIC
MFEALLLGLLSAACIYDVLGPTLLYAGRPLIAGSLAGLIIGHLTLGMAVGGTLELTALGVYTYGGASTPDYQTGAIVGTALAAHVVGGLIAQVPVGIAIGLPAAILLTSLDPVARTLTTLWIHRADTYVDEGSSRGVTWMHWTAFIPWGLSRGIPAFLATLAAGTSTVINVEHAIPAGFTQGMTLVGGMLPAVGFAMLLTIMPVKRFWFMLPIGFVLYAYLSMPLVGIAIVGVGIAAIYMRLHSSNVEAPKLNV